MRWKPNNNKLCVQSAATFQLYTHIHTHTHTHTHTHIHSPLINNLPTPCPLLEASTIRSLKYGSGVLLSILLPLASTSTKPFIHGSPHKKLSHACAMLLKKDKGVSVCDCVCVCVFCCGGGGGEGGFSTTTSMVCALGSIQKEV